MFSFHFLYCDLQSCWRIRSSSPLTPTQDTPVVCAGVLWAARAWLSLASCGSAVMRIWRRTRAQTWSQSRTRNPGQCLFTGQTPQVREVNITSSSQQKPHNRDDVERKGEKEIKKERERERAVLVETSEISFWVYCRERELFAKVFIGETCSLCNNMHHSRSAASANY